MEIISGWISYAFAGFIGACIGSLLNVCIVRIPREESIVWPGSHCRTCDHKISWWENIPIISYIFLHGRCRKCKQKISIQYPIVEILTMLLSIATWWYLGRIGMYLAYFLLLIAPLIVISFIDLEHKIIPNSISLPGIVAGIGINMIFGGRYGYVAAFTNSMLGIVVGGGFLFIVAFAYEKIKKQEGMGGGDVKLAAMLGAFFGWQASIFILLVSSMLGSVIGIIIIVVTGKDSRFAIPFGPFLATAALIYFFFGEKIISWYLGIF